jgi:hypothetical protein
VSATVAAIVIKRKKPLKSIVVECDTGAIDLLSAPAGVVAPRAAD